MVNERMKKSDPQIVYGQTAPTPKVTLAAAFLLACVVSVPVVAVLTVVEWLWL